MESLRPGVLLLPLLAMVVLGVPREPNGHRHELDDVISSALREQHPSYGINPVIDDPSDKLKDLEVPTWPLDLVVEPVKKKPKARQNPKKYQPPSKSTSDAPTTTTTTSTTTSTVEVSSTTTTPSTEMTSH